MRREGNRANKIMATKRGVKKWFKQDPILKKGS